MHGVILCLDLRITNALSCAPQTAASYLALFPLQLPVDDELPSLVLEVALLDLLYQQ